MPAKRKELLTQFVEWVGAHITGDEKSQAQIYLDRLFIALGHKCCLDIGGTPEFRIRKPKESGGGTAFAEDIDLLPRHFAVRLLDDYKAPADSLDLLGGLFEATNTQDSSSVSTQPNSRVCIPTTRP
ncbi:MAG: hypothetical protein ACE5GE_04490, partial [Phycisphaerae bacterium]